MRDEGRIAGILLAAGASTRMGTNKMLLRIDGETIVHRAARRAMEGGLAPIFVILGANADAVEAALIGLPCKFELNSDFTGPTSTSLHLGLHAVPERNAAAVVLLADMVHVTEQMIRALVDASRAGAEPLVVSRYGDVVAPPLLFKRELFDELLAWHGEGCGKQVVMKHRKEAAYIDWPAAALQDVDTPEDFNSL